MPPSRPPPGLTRTDRPTLSWGEKLEDGGRRGQEGPERYTSLQGGHQDRGSWNKAEQDKAVQSLYHRHHINNLHQRSCVPSDLGALGSPTASPSLLREHLPQPPTSSLVYDEVLQQHRRLLSKLDLEEKKRKEAKEGGESGGGTRGGFWEGVVGRRWLLVLTHKLRHSLRIQNNISLAFLSLGYYYDLDESYDESDEEEVKAHLRRVTEQPPLKLDTSSEVNKHQDMSV